MDGDLPQQLCRSGTVPLHVTPHGIVARARRRRRRARFGAILACLAVLVLGAVCVARLTPTERVVLAEGSSVDGQPSPAPADGSSEEAREAGPTARPLVPDLPDLDPATQAEQGLPVMPDHPALFALAEETAPEGLTRTADGRLEGVTPPSPPPQGVRRPIVTTGGITFDAGAGRSVQLSYFPLKWNGDVDAYALRVADQESDVRLVTLPDLTFGLVEERTAEDFTLQFPVADVFVSLSVQGRAGLDGDQPPLTVEQAIAWAAAMRAGAWWTTPTELPAPIEVRPDDPRVGVPALCSRAFDRVALPGAYGTSDIDVTTTLDFCDPEDWLRAVPWFADGLPQPVWSDPAAWRAEQCRPTPDRRACPSPG